MMHAFLNIWLNCLLHSDKQTTTKLQCLCYLNSSFESEGIKILEN